MLKWERSIIKSSFTGFLVISLDSRGVKTKKARRLHSCHCTAGRFQGLLQLFDSLNGCAPVGPHLPVKALLTLLQPEMSKREKTIRHTPDSALCLPQLYIIDDNGNLLNYNQFCTKHDLNPSFLDFTRLCSAFAKELIFISKSTLANHTASPHIPTLLTQGTLILDRNVQKQFTRKCLPEVCKTEMIFLINLIKKRL